MPEETTTTIVERLTRIETKLEMYMSNDHEGRIRALENFRWYILGAALVAAPVISFFIDRVIK